MSVRTTRILCVDDHAFLVDGMQTRIALEDDLEFVGSVGTADDLVGEVERRGADIVLLDVEMPGPDPFEALEDLHRRCPDVRVLMLSAYVRDHYLDAALNAGAWGYLSKSDPPAEVIAAIRKVRDGAFAFGSTVLERCQVDERGGRPASRLSTLTPREIQVLRMIGKGMSRQEIAEATHRSPKTIDNHRAAIMEKLGIHDRVELARYAISEGLAEL